MISITISPIETELWDEENETFIHVPVQKEKKLCLEHSLVSISKWEEKWHKPFIHSKKSDEEFIDYIKCMTINSNVSDETYLRLTRENMEEIKKYIEDPMTATTFSNRNANKPNREIITSEIIYSWMITLNIPVEFQKWHINRLLTLIRVCEINNNPPKKLSKSEAIRRTAAVNAARRKRKR